MCRQHLLGEHVEIHMLIGAIKKKKNIKGFLKSGLLAPQVAFRRHEELVEEMVRRGYNHKSPLEDVLITEDLNGIIDVAKNRKALKERCDRCHQRMVLW